MSAQDKELSFEKSMKRLEEIVDKIENGQLPLEEALKYYEEGVLLADQCQKRLSDAQKKVEVLMKTSSGKFKKEDLDTSDKASAKSSKKKNKEE